jgi:hypothetical protein
LNSLNQLNEIKNSIDKLLEKQFNEIKISGGNCKWREIEQIRLLNTIRNDLNYLNNKEDFITTINIINGSKKRNWIVRTFYKLIGLFTGKENTV